MPFDIREQVRQYRDAQVNDLLVNGLGLCIRRTRGRRFPTLLCPIKGIHVRVFKNVVVVTVHLVNIVFVIPEARFAHGPCDTVIYAGSFGCCAPLAVDKVREETLGM